MSLISHDDDTLIEGPLYAAALKIYPQSVHGTFRRIKWTVLIITLGIYYLLPFIRWDRGPSEPSQAVLLDMVNKRFYFFFIEIWPQEVYYLTGLLILAALTLFLMNALAGRVWCGYLCPQTVWTDLFFAVERWVEGDRRARMQNDAAPWTGSLIARKALKHFLLGAVFFRCAHIGEKPDHIYRAHDCLCLDRHSDLHHLCAGWPYARAGLSVYVPLAAHSGRADR